MDGFAWNEYWIVGLLVICVLGPIAIVLLTQNFFDDPEDVGARHYDFKSLPDNNDDGKADNGASGDRDR
jgi:hypothetical protein